jgi:phosphoribosylformylglycinamidine (FGAM) synthase-like enzyme
MQSFLCSRGHRVRVRIAKANQAKAKVERAGATVDLAREEKEARAEKGAKAMTVTADPVVPVARVDPRMASQLAVTAAAAAVAAVRVRDRRIRPSLPTVAVRAVRLPRLVRSLPLVWQRRNFFKIELDSHALRMRQFLP